VTQQHPSPSAGSGDDADARADEDVEPETLGGATSTTSIRRNGMAFDMLVIPEWVLDVDA
jgi:hypothetical protein